jgi:hypothetical protein
MFLFMSGEQKNINIVLLIGCKMLLYEVFDQPDEWKVTDHQDDFLEVVFTIGSIGYTFRASAVHDNEGDMIQPPHFDIEFYAQVPSEKNPDKSYGVTRTGNQQRLFATVVDIMREFIKEYNPDVISLSAKEPSRMKLYQRMLSTLLPDWRVLTNGTYIKAFNQY